MKIVTTDEMRAIEETSEKLGVSRDRLLENAGLATARRIRDKFGPVKGIPILVLVGSGKNGTDGLIAARHLVAWGANVSIYLCAPRPPLDVKLDLLKQKHIPFTKASNDRNLSALKQSLHGTHVVLDSILGTGHTRPIKGTLKRILLALNKAHSMDPSLRIVSLDLPTGLDPNTGEVDPVSPHADLTISLGYPKRGHYTYPGCEILGYLENVDIGIPPELDSDVKLELVTEKYARAALPDRPSNAHKGTFGRTMVVAGSKNYLGAVYLSATSAMRVGAGLVTIAIIDSLRRELVTKTVEPTFLSLPESTCGIMPSEACSLIFNNLPEYKSLLVGCGLGQEKCTKEFINLLLLSNEKLPPTVIDADGLNILSHVDNWWEQLPFDAVLTPHPGEMERLTNGISRKQDRFTAATTAASQWNKTIVLKGQHTVIAFPDGRAIISPFSNPGLSTAGTGDVLSGVIAGLISQGLSLADAAVLGVYLHGLAGEHMRETLGHAGMVASDLLIVLPTTIRKLRHSINNGLKYQ